MVEVLAFIFFVICIFYAIVWSVKHDPEAIARKQKRTPTPWRKG
jgi:preprotein translocase subunit SecG